MPFTKIWIHFVWSTKNRTPDLTVVIRNQVFSHILENAKSKGIFIDSINGHLEHVHCLVSLGTDQTISKIMQLIKGESAFWANKNGLLKSRKLEWQEEYFGVSVSESMVSIVRKYIWNQEEHHRKKTFSEEYDEFINKYGFSKFE